MSLGSVAYRIYIGKTKSLQRPVSDYLKEFQPHSPNEYKLRIFQQVVLEHEPSTAFHLYFAGADLTRYTQLETEALRTYNSLLNKPTRASAQVKAAFKNAFEVYYRQGFEERLGRPG